MSQPRTVQAHPKGDSGPRHRFGALARWAACVAATCLVLGVSATPVTATSQTTTATETCDLPDWAVTMTVHETMGAPWNMELTATYTTLGAGCVASWSVHHVEHSSFPCVVSGANTSDINVTGAGMTLLGAGAGPSPQEWGLDPERPWHIRMPFPSEDTHYVIGGSFTACDGTVTVQPDAQHRKPPQQPMFMPYTLEQLDAMPVGAHLEGAATRDTSSPDVSHMTTVTWTADKLDQERLDVVDDRYDRQTRASGQGLNLSVLDNDTGDGVHITGTGSVTQTGGPPALDLGSLQAVGDQVQWVIPEQPGGAPLLGEFTMTYTAADARGHSDEGTVTVTLYDCATVKTRVHLGQGSYLRPDSKGSLRWSGISYCFDAIHPVDQSNLGDVSLSTGDLGRVTELLGFSLSWNKPIAVYPLKSGRGAVLVSRGDRRNPPALRMCVDVPLKGLVKTMSKVPVKILRKVVRIIDADRAKKDKDDLIDLIFGFFNDYANPACRRIDKVDERFIPQDDGQFTYAVNYGRTQGGYFHDFRIRYTSGAPTPREVDLGWPVEYGLKRTIVVARSCLPYQVACRPTIIGQESPQNPPR